MSNLEHLDVLYGSSDCDQNESETDQMTEVDRGETNFEKSSSLSQVTACDGVNYTISGSEAVAIPGTLPVV